jgi:hypothetical protein
MYFVDRDYSGVWATQLPLFLHILHSAKWLIRAGKAQSVCLFKHKERRAFVRNTTFSARATHGTTSSQTLEKRIPHYHHHFALQPDECRSCDATTPGDALITLSGAASDNPCSATFESEAGPILSCREVVE